MSETINHPWDSLTIPQLQDRGQFWKYHYDRTTNPLLKQRIISMFNSYMNETLADRVASAS